MDRPILFSGPMVRALLDGRKTQTRRVLSSDRYASLFNGGWADSFVLDPGNQSWRDSEVRYAVGDRLYVREAWRTFPELDHLSPSKLDVGVGILPMADTGVSFPSPLWGKFRQGMHMPRWASRLALTVTDVRVQRLLEISEEDAIAEGITQHGRFFGVADAEWDSASAVSAVDAYANLWDDLNEARGFGWETNPWVVAVSFTVERRNIDAEAV